MTRLWVYDIALNEALGILENYETLTITRRYDNAGEIEFTAPMTPLEDGGKLLPGMVIWPQYEDEAYMLTHVTLAEKRGSVQMNAKGRALSAILDQRCLPDVAYYVGMPGYIIRRLTEDVFADTARSFPGWTMKPADALGVTMTYLTGGETLLEAICAICQSAGLGFRTVFNPAVCNLRFELYEGMDRFMDGAASPLTLDPAYDNLLGLSAEDSTEDHGSVIYMLGEVNRSTGIARKIAVDAEFETTGQRSSGYDRFERIRRFSAGSVTDNASTGVSITGGASIQLTESQYRDAMLGIAHQELLDRSRAVIVSGAIDYTTAEDNLSLGDIVRVRARHWGVDTASRVRALIDTHNKGWTSRRAVIGRL